MIELGIYYIIGLIVILPTTSILGTKLYYKNKIYELERQLWLQQNINISSFINEIEEKELSFEDKRVVVEKFLELNNKL